MAKKAPAGRPGAVTLGNIIKATQQAAAAQAKAVQKALHKAGARGLTVVVPRAPKGR